MTDVIANSFADVHTFISKLTLYLDSNCFSIESTVSGYSLWQMLLRVLADGSTSSQRNASNDRSSSRFDLAIHGIGAKPYTNIR